MIAVSASGTDGGNGRLRAQPQDVGQRQRTGVYEVAKRRALDVLHRDEAQAVGLTNLIDGTNVRVIERGGITRLSQQPLAGRIVARVHGHLEPHVAMQRRVVREVDLAHPSTPQHRVNAVGA